MRDSILAIEHHAHAQRALPHARTSPLLLRLAAIALFVSLLAAHSVAPRAQTQTPKASAAASVSAQSSSAAPASAERERGVALYQRGDEAGAVKALRAAVQSNKRDAVAWYFLGLALKGVKNRDEARKAFEKALELDADSEQARIGLATLLLEEDRPLEVEREATRVLSRNQANAEAHMLISFLRLREDKIEEALASADRALQIAPENFAALLFKGRALLHLYGKREMALRSKYQLATEASEEERDERVQTELASLKSELRETARLLEKFIGQEPAAAPSREIFESLRFYGETGKLTRAGISPPLRPLPSSGVQRAAILSKPEPGFTKDGREACTNGTVRLRMVLGADGKVRYMLPLKTLDHGLTLRAMAAARNITFKPAIKDGKPVSQWVVIEYGFHCR